VKGKVCRACIQSVLGYASETWAVKVKDMARLERTERMMVRLMCGVLSKIITASAELNCRLDIECITDMVKGSRLQWFGHGERKDSDEWVVEVLKLME